MIEWIKNHKVHISIGILILLVTIVSATWEKPQEDFEPFFQKEDIVSDIEYIYVDIKGEVKNPGVYKLESNSRVYQVVDKAGGFTIEADTNAINLSKIIRDQEVVYVPSNNEEFPLITDTYENENNGIININFASKSLLETLPGIGPSTAQKIVDYRDNNGNFNVIDDIMNVSGVGESTFEEIKDFITVN